MSKNVLANDSDIIVSFPTYILSASLTRVTNPLQNRHHRCAIDMYFCLFCCLSSVGEIPEGIKAK